MRFDRAAGVLVHPTSFPSRYGIGDLGDNAYRFVDFLVASQQSLWQILPLGPTGYGDSPYQNFSAFAGNPLLISPAKLVRDGFLPARALDSIPVFPSARVDFGAVIDYKNDLFPEVYRHFLAIGSNEHRMAFNEFCHDQAHWLNDFTLFMALKKHHIDESGGIWNMWPAEIARREPEAMASWSAKLADEIGLQKFLQFLFFRQWLTLKKYANDRGIRIIGDVPIFIAFDSSDVWANPDLFYLDETGAPTVVAGVPPDYFSATGQRWGNPLYRWDKMKEGGYPWWIARLKMVLTQVDIMRIDHFRGFDAYWEIPATEETAVIGRWVKGPGKPFFDHIQDELGELPIIAEDLGVITPEVAALRDDLGFPGMKILQFAFGDAPDNDFLPHTYTRNCVVYTGTHDNETTIGWYNNAGDATRDFVRRYIARDGYDIAWDMIRLALSSVADMAVVPLQDLMRLGNKARMNFPGRLGGNWQWQYKPEMLTDETAKQLGEMTTIYGRVPGDDTLKTELATITTEDA